MPTYVTGTWCRRLENYPTLVKEHNFWLSEEDCSYSKHEKVCNCEAKGRACMPVECCFTVNCYMLLAANLLALV
jgi:hypothetical protein